MNFLTYHRDVELGEQDQSLDLGGYVILLY